MTEPLTVEKVLTQCAALHAAKDSDYAGGVRYGNFLSSNRFGVRPHIGVMVRLSDKYNRVVVLLQKERAGEARRVLDESIDDTLRDLVNYAGIMAALHTGSVQYGFTDFLQAVHQLHAEYPTIEDPGSVLDRNFTALCRAVSVEVWEGQAVVARPLWPVLTSIACAAAEMLVERGKGRR